MTIAFLLTLLEPLIIQLLTSGLSELEASAKANSTVTGQLEFLGLEALIPFIPKATQLAIDGFNAGLHQTAAKVVTPGAEADKGITTGGEAPAPEPVNPTPGNPASETPGAILDKE